MILIGIVALALLIALWFLSQYRQHPYIRAVRPLRNLAETSELTAEQCEELRHSRDELRRMLDESPNRWTYPTSVVKAKLLIDQLDELIRERCHD
jgi:hypothetical protein